MKLLPEKYLIIALSSGSFTEQKQNKLMSLHHCLFSFYIYIVLISISNIFYSLSTYNFILHQFNYGSYLEKEMATHFSIPAWEISWTEVPVGLWSMGSQGLDTTQRLNHCHHPTMGHIIMEAALILWLTVWVLALKSSYTTIKLGLFQGCKDSSIYTN